MEYAAVETYDFQPLDAPALFMPSCWAGTWKMIIDPNDTDMSHLIGLPFVELAPMIGEKI